MALNEYGEKLDRNGYAKSIFATKPNVCWLCHQAAVTERHEVFGGALRNKSKALGLWMNLCGGCHRTSPDAVHQSNRTATKLKAIAQKMAMQKYEWSHDEWVRRFYKNYLEE